MSEEIKLDDMKVTKSKRRGQEEETEEDTEDTETDTEEDAEEETEEAEEGSGEAGEKAAPEGQAGEAAEGTEGTEGAEGAEGAEMRSGLPFPEAAVVRIMKKNLDSEKMIKKDVKLAMNKWLGEVCAQVARNMNAFPYVMMNMNEFKEGIKVYENLAEFQNEKDRVLAHMNAIKKDIEKLERDLGKMDLIQGEEIIIEKKEE